MSFSIRSLIDDKTGIPGNTLASFGRTLLAFTSLATIHVLFFCLNIESALWIAVDINLIANITFAFALFFSLALFTFRAVPLIIITSITFIFIFLWGCRSRAHEKNRISPYVQPTFTRWFLNALLKEQHKKQYTLTIYLVRLIRPFLINVVPLPSKAGAKLMQRAIHRLERRTTTMHIASVVSASFVILHFYTGYSMLQAMVPIFYLGAVGLFMGALRLDNKENKTMGNALSDAYLENNIHKLAIAPARAKSHFISLVFLVAGGIAAVSGSLRYDFLSNEAPQVIRTLDGTVLSAIPIVKNANGLIVVEAKSENQMYLFFGDLASISRKTDQ